MFAEEETAVGNVWLQDKTLTESDVSVAAAVDVAVTGMT